MHVNILQYKHYLKLHGRSREINRIILLTPNEGLSKQHLEEFHLSDIEAEIFSKEGRGLFTGRSVEIIEISKLREESGDKTVAVEAFEGNNLVLVDEGHTGASRGTEGAWLERRRQLCENGFSFEYSATFSQALKNNKDLEQQYAKWILFDYSYRYFYRDGYGKDYRILNLEDDSQENTRHQYLTACLLTFYQQLKLFADQEKTLASYLIERPLWIFVGGSVNAVRTQDGKIVSDVIDILLFLSTFVSNRENSEEIIQRLLDGKSGLLNAQGHEIFGSTFQYLNALGKSGEEVFQDILQLLFNSGQTAALHVENLKGPEGEVALRLGDNEPFGVINVGDEDKLCKLCDEEHGDVLKVTDKDFSTSLFHGLNAKESRINILIGSRKFTQGWSSWRVSTMGLMNIGRSEGPQIIQLFGRGVRLKGKDFSLKRSSRMIDVRPPSNIGTVETLNIFGIRADYMGKFKEYLEDEGLPSNEDRIEFILPVIKDLGKKKLKIIRLKDDVDFKKDGPKPELGEIPDAIKRYPVVVDWYPKLQMMVSGRSKNEGQELERHKAHFDESHLAFLDLDSVYFDLQQYKNEKSWHNFNLSSDSLPSLLKNKDWYTLYIPEEEMNAQSFRQIQTWQQVATALLKKFADRYYKYRKSEWESGYLEYRELREDDPNFFDEYRLMIEQSREDVLQKLDELKDLIGSGSLKNWQFLSLQAIGFSNHLYQPLLYAGDNLIEVKPVVLDNEGERDFVLDLKSYCESNPEFLKDKELYLLRNMSRGRGLGFFEAGNFYPDFILWLLHNGKQYVNFIDPKGIRNLPISDGKIQFHKEIKILEQRLGDPNVILNSFIVTETRIVELLWSDTVTVEDLELNNVLTRDEPDLRHIGLLLEKSIQLIDL
jgi:hypothetical protein